MVSTSFIAAALSTLPMAFAYYPAANGTSTYPPMPSGTGAGKAVHNVAVGKNGLTFTPDTVNARVGEQIVFTFSAKNHTVTQSEFNNPCNPSEGGIFSGFNFFVPEGTANQTFTITVADERPVWLYCSQTKPMPHCAAGMVAVINPPASGPNTLDAYKQLAARTNTSTSPATGPSGGQITSPGSSGSPGSPSSPSSPGSPSSPNSPSGTSTNVPAESTGGASSLAVSGALGAVAVVAGFFL